MDKLHTLSNEYDGCGQAIVDDMTNFSMTRRAQPSIRGRRIDNFITPKDIDDWLAILAANTVLAQGNCSTNLANATQPPLNVPQISGIQQASPVPPQVPPPTQSGSGGLQQAADVQQLAAIPGQMTLDDGDDGEAVQDEEASQMTDGHTSPLSTTESSSNELEEQTFLQI